MQRLRLGRRQWGALLGVAAAAVPAVALWHFTVDDALISARYADHLARGIGYRFNASGPATDGVTPLGWAYLLAPWGGSGPLAVLRAAKLLGLVAWLVAAAVLGDAIACRTEKRRGLLALLLVLCSAPMAAWSVAGMETGVAMALGAVSVSALLHGRPLLAAGSAGLVAWLRPEALPWALVMALAPVQLPSSSPPASKLEVRPTEASSGPRDGRRAAWRPDLRRLALAVGPFVLVAAVRLAIFGRAAPLALLAKPSDFAHGWRYALAGAILTGPIALLAIRRIDSWCRLVQLSVLVHLAAVTFAGGDWMPLSRLLVPVLPAVVAGAAHALDRGYAPVALLRLSAAIAGLAFVIVKVGPSAARVELDRRAVIAELRPSLQTATVVATLDIGWVGAATRADVLDLAGVTDPAIATLPGGHTTKRIPRTLFENRDVDAVVLLLAQTDALVTPWHRSWFARGVEQRVAELPLVAQQLELVAASRNPRLPYVVARRPVATAR